MTDEPALLVTPNAAALDLLVSLLTDLPSDPLSDIPVVETTLTLRITGADVRRFREGNGELLRIVLDEGGDGFPFPDALA